MSNNIKRVNCPICGVHTEIFEDEFSPVDCPKCGKYRYHLSVHPFLTEKRFRNPVVLARLSEKVTAASRLGKVSDIDLEMYQKLVAT
jgi:endogenous inhibitor of DNA gyrase (YacG/DUF329 family)